MATGTDRLLRVTEIYKNKEKLKKNLEFMFCNFWVACLLHTWNFAGFHSSQLATIDASLK
jgi:hypothetical protein